MKDRKMMFAKKYTVTESGCWIWHGGSNERGYGRVRYHYKQIPAHRLAYILYRGPVADGVIVCHKCDTPACVNPDHLFLGTLQDNSRDMVAKGRHRGPRGVRHHEAKLTPDAVREIRTGALTGREYAEKFGVCEASISQVVHRMTWKGVL